MPTNEHVQSGELAMAAAFILFLFSASLTVCFPIECGSWIKPLDQAQMARLPIAQLSIVLFFLHHELVRDLMFTASISRLDYAAFFSHRKYVISLTVLCCFPCLRIMLFVLIKKLIFEIMTQVEIWGWLENNSSDKGAFKQIGRLYIIIPWMQRLYELVIAK